MRHSREAVRTFEDILPRIETLERVPASIVCQRSIPIERGIYAWFALGDQRPTYVGKATGRRGLRGRIWSQHLNVRYLESRPEKWTSEDQPQISLGLVHNGRVAIEKSAFRKALARRYSLRPGAATVDFIKQNYELVIIPLGQLDAIDIYEREKWLIAKFNPLLNRAGNAA